MKDPDKPAFGSAQEANSFDNLLRHFDADRDRAAQKYKGVRQGLIRYFQRSRRFPAEELADETLEQVAAKLDETTLMRTRVVTLIREDLPAPKPSSLSFDVTACVCKVFGFFAHVYMNKGGRVEGRSMQKCGKTIATL